MSQKENVDREFGIDYPKKRSNMNNLESLRVFLEVVKQGSFAEAARHLNQPTTSISRKIKQLEDELGARLIHRTTRSQSMTEAGAAALPKAEAVLASLRELTDEMSRKRHSPDGLLSISGSATILHYLAPTFARFSRQFPDVSLHFESASRYQNLIDDRLDFAFRVGPLTDSSLIARRIMPMTSCLVASPSFLRGKTFPTHPSQISSLPCLRSQIDGYVTPWTLSKEGEQYQIQSDGHFMCDDLVLCLKMAEQGMGIAYLPENLVRSHIEDGTLLPMLKDWLPEERDLYLVYQEKSYLPPKSRAFVEFLTNEKSFDS